MNLNSQFARVLGFACLFGSFLLLAGCVVGGPGSQSTGISVRMSPYKVSLDTPSLMCGGTLVVNAAVSTVLPGYWNTPTGALPASVDSAAKVTDAGYAIYTPLQLSSLHIYVDHRQQPTAAYALLGGRVGADTYNVEETPQVIAGTTYLFIFFPGVPLQGQAHTEKLLVVGEAFPIDAQGIVTLHEAHDEGKGASTQHYPAVTMPLSQITQQLANCK